jgi:hypothetical protein
MSYIDTMDRASVRGVRRCRCFADGQRDLVRFDVADGADLHGSPAYRYTRRGWVPVTEPAIASRVLFTGDYMPICRDEAALVAAALRRWFAGGPLPL